MSNMLDNLSLAIKRVQAQNHRSLDQRLGSLGISLVQWNALREIHRNPGVSAHALSELTFNSDQAFGTLAARLVRLGLVLRRAGKGKIIVHHLSPKGIDLLSKGAAIHREYLKAAFGPLNSQEKTILLSLLLRLLNRDDEDGV